MSMVSTLGGSQSRPVRLTLDLIVDTAQRLVSDEGYDAVSMRRLARELGVGAMTLYGYVRTKEELLAALADRLLASVETPVGDEPWQRQLADLMRSVRTAFRDHPELIPIVGAQRLEGLGAYRGAEAFFSALRAAGMDDQQVVNTFGVLVSFVVGFVQREVGLGRGPGELLPGLRTLPRDEFPHVYSLAGQLVTRDMDLGFQAGIDLLITGIEGMVRS